MRSLILAVAAAIAVAGPVPVAFAKTLTYCAEGAPEGFDPARFVTAATFDASSQAIYNRLTEFAPGTANVVPGLAESWDVSEDGLTYTFHLREGVHFQTTRSFTPSRDFNADDVVFSLQRQRDPKNAYYDYAGGQWPYYSAMSLDVLVKAIKKVDGTTVAITLTEPNASLPAILAMDFASILSKEYADQLAKADTRDLLDSAPVGTGPFRLVAHLPGVASRYRANADYWRAPPKIDLMIVATPDPAERLKKLKAGDCQAMADPDAASLRAAAADDTLAIAEADRLDVAFLAFNTTRAPFNDPRVRRALSLAIDRQAIVNAVYGGEASAATTLLPPSTWAYAADASDPASNAAEAKRLLSEMGIRSLKLPLLTTNLARPYNPDPQKVASMVAADLAKAGVEATVVVPDRLSDFLRQASDPDRDGAVLIGWTSDNGDPDNFLNVLLSCHAVGSSNRAQWCDEAFTGLLDQARSATDPAARAALYQQAQSLLASEEPLTPLAHTVVSVPLSKSVRGFVASPLGHHNFERVTIAE